MRGVQVDPEQRLAHVKGGVLWGDVDRKTQACGLATPGGTVSDTGIVGLTLGGGYGWLRRKYGLSCDNVVRAQVVCADSQVRTASAEHNPDLFWAIRGGGGNFGIVTSFTFGLHPVGPVVAFAAPLYPLEDVADVMRGWRDFLMGAPDEIISMVVAITLPAAPSLPEVVHNRACVIVGGIYAGDPDGGTGQGGFPRSPVRLRSQPELLVPADEYARPRGPARLARRATQAATGPQRAHSWPSRVANQATAHRVADIAA
jgi:FAD/FMN-containing dehydrogenase